MINHKKVAVVILNWNGSELLKQFLPSVIKNSNDSDVRIIIADNGSTDDSIAVLKSYFPEVEILDLETNYGFAKGYNVALSQIEADYFVILNSDVEVTENWIEQCIQRMEQDIKVSAVQPKVLSFDRKDEFEYAGATGGFIDKFGYPFCRGRILNVCEKDEGQYNSPSEIFWGTGACMFVRAETFKKAGGFDEDFWAHMEEIDLCWRLKNQGYTIWYEPQSTVYHLGGGTLSYDSPKKLFLNFRNNLWMLYKNLPKNKFYSILFMRMILDGVASVKFLVGLNGQAALAVLKSALPFLYIIGQIQAKKKSLITEGCKNKTPRNLSIEFNVAFLHPEN